MKKLLGMTLALAMFVPAGANAELLKNLKTSGSLDIQTTSARNVLDFATRPTHANGGTGPGAADNNDRIGHATTRVILKLGWDVLDDVHSNVTLVKGAGDNAGVGQTRTYGTAAQNLDNVQATVLIQEANVKIDKVFGALDITAGRQFYGEEGDLIIYYGPRDAYGLRTDAVDMFRADWNGEHMAVTGIAGKTADGTAVQTGPNGGTDLRGITVSCKMHEMVKPSLYVYNQVEHATKGLGTSGTSGVGGNGGKNTNLWIMGLKAKFATGGLTASLEAAINRGEDRSNQINTSYKGYAYQAKVAYKAEVSNVGMITPWGEYGMGTGDNNGVFAGNRNFQSVNTDYRPGGIYGRFDKNASLRTYGNTATPAGGFGTASDGLSNRVIWGLGVKATPSGLNKLTVGAAFYRYAFDRLPENEVVTGLAYTSARISRNIGSEVNVTAEWKHSENVSLKATAGSFKPGAAIADIKGPNAILNPAVMLAGDVAIKF